MAAMGRSHPQSGSERSDGAQKVAGFPPRAARQPRGAEGSREMVWSRKSRAGESRRVLRTLRVRTPAHRRGIAEAVPHAGDIARAVVLTKSQEPGTGGWPRLLWRRRRPPRALAQSGACPTDLYAEGPAGRQRTRDLGATEESKAAGHPGVVVTTIPDR